jgi:predicted aspartyl protease
VGLTYIDGRVRASGRTRKSRRVRFFVDSGAVYSVLRQADWRALGLKPSRTLDFVLADGTTLSRGVSECTFEIQGHRATSPVVLGETEDEALLGAVTLETLGLMLNPLTRTLQPMRLVLASRRRLTIPETRVPAKHAAMTGVLAAQPPTQSRPIAASGHLTACA